MLAIFELYAGLKSTNLKLLGLLVQQDQRVLPGLEFQPEALLVRLAASQDQLALDQPVVLLASLDLQVLLVA